MLVRQSFDDRFVTKLKEIESKYSIEMLEIDGIGPNKLDINRFARNFFKKNDDGSYVNMVTYRQYDGTQKSFEDKVEHLKSVLDDSGFKYDKVVTEFSIYDTKVSHDFRWVEKSEAI